MFWRQTVLPLVNRVATALSSWLAPAYDPVSGFGLTPRLELRPDLDQLPALAPEREALWTQLEKSTFLTTNEKRAAAGYGPLSEADVTDAKFNPHHDALGRFTTGPSGADGSDKPQPAQAKPGRGGGGGGGGGGNRGQGGGQGGTPPKPGHNHPSGPTLPVPPIVPVPETPSPDPPSGGGNGSDDLPEFLKKKPGPGSLTGELDTLTSVERAFAAEMRDLGNIVEILRPTSVGRTPDFKINGKQYELKTVSGAEPTTADHLSAVLSNRIMNGRGQSGDIIVDARQQSGMTPAVGARGIIRAYGRDNQTGSKITSITVLTPTKPVYSPRKQ